MKILFIIHDVYQDFNMFPLGPGYLATLMMERGHTVDIYNMDLYHYTLKELGCFLKKNSYDIIGMGFLSARYRETIEPVCEVINRYKKRAWFILGGHGASATPDYILEKTKCDGIVVGEAENSIDDILNERKRMYTSNIVNDLDSLPYPAWNIFPMDLYTTCKKYPNQKTNEKSMNIITSRGCVNSCSFCYRMHEGLRIRDIYKVVDEIKYLQDTYNISYFFFADEFFSLNKRRLEMFRNKLDEENIKIKYMCASRVKGADEESLNIMKETGCQLINYGFESQDENVLKLMHKNTTPEDNINAAELTKDCGIGMGINFIWNCPGDTKESLRKNMEFIKKYNTYKQVRTIRPVTPYPGCELYYKAIKDGILEGPEDFYSRFKNSDLIMVNFTDMEIPDMYDSLYHTNKELLLDHSYHSDMSARECIDMQRAYWNLYFKKDFAFRGVRKYDKK